MNAEAIQRQATAGLLYAVAAYTMWGIAPLYFKQIASVPAPDILMHRIVWSAALLALLLLGLGQFAKVKAIFRSKRLMGLLAVASVLLGGNWLLFLHADAILEPDWMRAVADFMGAAENVYHGAYFRFALDDEGAAARRLERLVAWRCRLLALPYGDQGLLLSRDFYEELGGFPPLPLMEDVALVRRIGRRRLSALDVRAVTSAARYRRGGYLRRSLRNLGCLALYFMNCPPHLIARLYRS